MRVLGCFGDGPTQTEFKGHLLEIMRNSKFGGEVRMSIQPQVVLQDLKNNPYICDILFLDAGCSDCFKVAQQLRGGL